MAFRNMPYLSIWIYFSKLVLAPSALRIDALQGDTAVIQVGQTCWNSILGSGVVSLNQVSS